MLGFPPGGGGGMVGVGVAVGGGAGSQIMGVIVGVRVIVGGGAGSQIMGVTEDAGVIVGVGDVRGGGAGSQTIGRQLLAAAASPDRTTIARTVLCKSLGSFCQGIIAPSCRPQSILRNPGAQARQLLPDFEVEHV